VRGSSAHHPLFRKETMSLFNIENEDDLESFFIVIAIYLIIVLTYFIVKN